NRITPATASCCSHSRSCAVSSVPEMPMTSMRVLSSGKVGGGAFVGRPLRIPIRRQGQIVIAQRVGGLHSGPFGQREGFIGVLQFYFSHHQSGVVTEKLV